MKKCIFIVLFSFLSIQIFADEFLDAIQDLAIVIACKGTYAGAEADYDEDPEDYYKPGMMARRFAEESGNKTMTETFYGVCFNYAQYAWTDINTYKSWYNSKGMYEGQFWLAGVHDNPNQIELMSIGTKNHYSSIQNGEYIITHPTSIRNIKTHNRITSHAWLWIERADGVWFWIDPTWTDTCGYVVYGYVSNETREEIQCKPDPYYCIEYPDYLNYLPPPPAMGKQLPPSNTANSTNRDETIKNAGKDWTDAITEQVSNTIDKTFINVNYNMNDSYLAVVFSANVPYEKIRDKNINMDKIGFGIDFQFAFDTIAMINGIEYLRNKEDGNNLHGIIFDFNYERRLFNNLAWYIGGGVGLRGDFSNKENIYAPKIYEKNSLVALKAETGFVVNISVLCAKVEISFDNILGLNVGAGIGFGMEI